MTDKASVVYINKWWVLKDCLLMFLLHTVVPAAPGTVNTKQLISFPETTYYTESLFPWKFLTRTHWMCAPSLICGRNPCTKAFTPNQCVSISNFKIEHFARTKKNKKISQIFLEDHLNLPLICLKRQHF